MNTDNSSTDVGWYLDDIRVYTCGRGSVPRTTPTVQGTPTIGSSLTATSHGRHASTFSAATAPVTTG
jgi:hypothetical protein